MCKIMAMKRCSCTGHTQYGNEGICNESVYHSLGMHAWWLTFDSVEVKDDLYFFHASPQKLKHEGLRWSLKSLKKYECVYTRTWQTKCSLRIHRMCQVANTTSAGQVPLALSSFPRLVWWTRTHVFGKPSDQTSSSQFSHCQHSRLN